VRNLEAALRQLASNEALRRLQVSWTLMIAASWAYTVAIAIVAYDLGGAGAVGLVVLVRSLVPALAGAPLTGLVASSMTSYQALVAASAAMTVALGATGTLAALAAPAACLYALGAVVAVATMVFRQAQSALLPTLTGSAHELTAANAAATTIEGAGILAGPLLGGAIVALASVTTTLHATAVLALLGTAAATTIKVPTALRERRPSRPDAAVGSLLGLRRAALDREVRLILGLLLAQTTVSGAFNVFVVVCAMELLDLGRAGVGTLTAAYGMGALLAGLGALAWAGRADLVRWVSVGLVLWGLPLLMLSAVPNGALALALVATIGLGNTLFDVASVTLLQRTVADDALATVFGALETVVVVGVGLGALLAPAAIEGLGLRHALIVTGALLPLVVLLARPALRELNASCALRLCPAPQ
jgi:hypothetical protein